MSVVIAAFEFLHARKWLVELLLGAALIGGLWIAYTHQIHKAEAHGISQQLAADDKAKSDLQKQVDALTAQNLVLARAAEAKYVADHAQNSAAAALPVGTSQLCRPSPAHGSGVLMPAAGSAHAGDGPGASTAPVVQPVPEADNGLADDRQRLLGALAAMADDGSAVIREYQARP